MIGGVLTYEIKSGGRACGQTIGADGSGEFAVVIDGAADVAEQWAKYHLRKIEASGARLGRVVFVAAADCYMGQTITVVQPNKVLSDLMGLTEEQRNKILQIHNGSLAQR